MAEEDIDKIPLVDPELQREREARRKAQRQQEEPPQEIEKPQSPTYPTSRPPKKDVPMGGVPTND